MAGYGAAGTDYNTFWYGRGGPSGADAGAFNAELSQANAGRERARENFANADQDYAYGQQVRNRQGGALEEMRLAAMGNGPSYGGEQMQAGLRAGQAGMQAQAASGRGMYGVAQGARNAAVNSAGMAIDTGANMGIVRAHEMANARNAYMRGTSNMRAGDAADQGLSVQQANEMNQSDLGWFEGRQGINQAQLRANEAYGTNSAASWDKAQNRNAQKSHDENAAGLGFAEGALSGGMKLSDERKKKNVADASSAADKMESDIVKQLSVQGPSTRPEGNLDAMSSAMGARSGLAQKFEDTLAPKSYQYKDPNDAWNKQPGTHLGVIAQNVEQAPGVGRQIVADTPEGKKLRLPELLSADTAAIGDLNQRLKMLEQMNLGVMSKQDKQSHLAAMTAAARKGGY